jgi:hypothetical protein
MKKQRLPVFVYGFLFLFLLYSCSVEENITVQSKTELIENTKKWFDNSKESQNLTILKHTKAILWENAIVSNGDNGEIIEVPILLEDDKATSIGTTKELKDYHRLLFAKDKNDNFRSYGIQIFTNESNFDNLNADFNFYKVNSDFNGTIIVFDGLEENTNFINFKRNKKTKPKLTHKDSDPMSEEYLCTFLGYLYEDGTFEPFMILSCIGSGGADFVSVGSGSGTYGGSGSSSNTSAPTPTPEPTPCSVGEKVTTTSQSDAFKTAFSNIIAASFDDNEHSITLGRDPKGHTTLSPMNNGGPNSVATNTSWLGAFADLHNHTTDGPPSTNDIVYAAVKKNSANNQHTTSFVTVPEGNYAIVVTNLAAAQAFVAAYPADLSPIYPPEFPNSIFYEIEYLRKELGESVEGRMRAVSFILDKYAAGIDILKQDSDGNFKSLKVEKITNPDGSITYKSLPCKN